MNRIVQSLFLIITLLSLSLGPFSYISGSRHSQNEHSSPDPPVSVTYLPEATVDPAGEDREAEGTITEVRGGGIQGELTRGEAGGSFFQSSEREFDDCTPNGVSISGHGEDARVNLSSRNVEGWMEMDPDDSPLGMYGHKMVYDSKNEKVVMFGGRTVEGQSSSKTWTFDTRDGEWTEMDPARSPAARYYHAMAYDSANDKVVMFAGYWTNAETWTYDMDENSWTLRSSQDHPPRLYAHAMAYDSINNKVVMFGGRTYSGGWRLFGETWTYDVAGNVWEKKDPYNSPSPRYSHAMTFDPVSGNIVLFGGYNGSNCGDTWTYDVSKDNWTLLHPESNPPARYQHEMVYDSEVHRIMLYGGYPYDSDCWLFDPAANVWTTRTYNDRPSSRYALGLAYDTTYGKAVLFGGYPNYPDETWNHDFFRYSPSGTLTSPVISLPDGHGWDLLSVEKTERPGTYINLTIIDAITSQAVQGFTNMPSSHVDLGELNGLGLTTIRLRAVFTGTVDITPVLYSWGIQWNRADMLYDGFVGDGNLRFSIDPDEHTSGLWRFREGAGQTLVDSSTNGNDGFLGGGDNIEPSDPIWIDSRFDGGLRFDGVDDFVWVDKDQSMKSDEALTVETWFKLDRCGKDTMSVLGGRSQGDYAIQILRNGTIRALLSTIDLELDEYNELYSRTMVDADRWYHVALVFDRPHIILYVNGMEEARRNVDFVLRHSSVPLFIGAEVGSSHFPYHPTNFFHGIIEELRITNDSTTPDVLLCNARGGLALEGGSAMIGKNVPSLSTNTVIHYDFERARGGVIEDSSLNRIYGYLYGDGAITDGLFGGALRLDGTDDRVSISDSSPLHLPSATYELWIRYEDDGLENILFFEEKSGSSEPNEVGMIDDEGHVHYMFDNGTYDIVTDEVIAPGEWTHLVLSRSSGTARIFIDGEECANGSYAGFEHDSWKRFHIGGRPYSPDSFNGLLDEMFIYNVPLPPSTIGDRGTFFLSKAGFRTKGLNLPGWDPREPENIWNTFRVEFASDQNPGLNISIHDNATEEALIEVPINGSIASVNLTKLNSIEHPSIFIQVIMTSDGKTSPKISNWMVNWSHVESPALKRHVLDEIVILEDTPTWDVLNMTDYFRDPYAEIVNSVFDIEWHSESESVGLELNGSTLDVTYLQENWTGLVEVIVNCTNMYGRSRTSNQFAMTVENVDDAPSWRTSPSPIVLNEDGNLTLPDYLSGHAYDVENNSLLFSVESDNENILAELTEGDTLWISGKEDYFGRGNITATAYQKYDPELRAELTIPVTITAVNDPPNVILTSPKKHSIQLSTTVSFSWEVLDVDSVMENVSFSFYLSKTFPPLMYLSDLYDTSVVIDELDDDATYFWKVIPSDDKSEGLCLNGTWSFNVNTNVLYPETTHLAPLNGTIITERAANLTWECFNPTMKDILYRVLFGMERDNLSVVGLTNDTWLMLDGLDDNTTYYWRIVPVAELVEGKCLSGIWSFRINITFVPTYDILVEASQGHVNITQGENATFNFTLTNLGNTPIIALLAVKGHLARYAVLKGEMLVPAGTTVKVNMTITDTDILAPNIYELTLEVTYPKGVKEHRVTLTISSESGGDDGKDTSAIMEPTTGILLAALLLIMIIFAVYIIRKKKERKEIKEEMELLEAEIVEPKPVRAPPPPLPPMDDRVALPQYAGTAAYAQWRENVLSLARQSYGPAPNGGQFPQLPQGGGQPPVPPPPDEQTYIPPPSVMLPDFKTEGPATPAFKMLPPAPPSGMNVPRIHAPFRDPRYAGTVPRTDAAGPPPVQHASPGMTPGAAEPTSASSAVPAPGTVPEPSSSPTPTPTAAPTHEPAPSSPPSSSPSSPSASAPTPSPSRGQTSRAEQPSPAPDEGPKEASASETLDALSKLIQEMPSSLNGKRPGTGQPPEPPGPPG